MNNYQLWAYAISPDSSKFIADYFWTKLEPDWARNASDNHAATNKLTIAKPRCRRCGSSHCSSAALERIMSDELNDEDIAMKPHERRVLQEKRELDERATKLSEFIGTSSIFPTLPVDEQERLREQCEIMWQYSEILGKRIAAFPV